MINSKKNTHRKASKNTCCYKILWYGGLITIREIFPHYQERFFKQY